MVTVKAAEFLVKYRVWNLKEFKAWAVEFCQFAEIPYHEFVYEMLFSHYRANI